VVPQFKQVFKLSWHSCLRMAFILAVHDRKKVKIPQYIWKNKYSIKAYDDLKSSDWKANFVMDH